LASRDSDPGRGEGAGSRPTTPSPDAPSARHRLLAALFVFLAVSGLAAATASDPGLTWDEAIYFGYAVSYVEWFRRPALDEPSLIRAWGGARPDPSTGRRRWVFPGQVHPPLGKVWIALWFALLGVGVASARIGAAFLSGGAAAALYLWGAARRGERAGWLAAAVLLLIPRVFGHGHLASLEMPTLLLWLLTVVAFEEGIARRGWSIACGVLFGLALLTRATALFLPLVLWPWGLIFHGRRALRNIVAMLLCGPAMFVAFWPGLWPDVASSATAWLRYWFGPGDSGRTLVPVFYLGRSWSDRPAPWHYPFVMLLATTPLPVLAGAVTGAAGWLARLGRRWRTEGHVALIVAAGGFHPILMAMPGGPRYDGVRLMLPAMPFLALLAAYGADDAWARVCARLRGRALRIATGGVLAAWLAAPVAAFHPFQLSYYGELVGGPWGAKRLGFETTYWDDTLTDEVLQWVKAHTRPGERVARVAVGDEVWAWHTHLGVLAPDERGPCPLDGDFASGEWETLIVIPRQGMWSEEVREFVATHEPARTWYLPPVGRVPVCLVYRKERAARP